MKPGRELDALVAEKVMGLSHKEMWGINDYRKDGSPVYMPDFPSYSEDIAAAWGVLHHLSTQVEAFNCSLSQAHDGLWYCSIKLAGNRSGGGVEHNGVSAPHAICLAVLKFVGALE